LAPGSVSGGLCDATRALFDARLRANQLSLIYDAGLALNSGLAPQSQFEYLAKILAQALQVDSVEVWQATSLTRALTLEVRLGPDEPGIRQSGGVAAEQVVATGFPLTTADLASPDDPGDETLRAGLWVPISNQERVGGVLGVRSRKPRVFTGQEERLLLLFANQVGVAMQNARLYAETQRRLHRLTA